MLFIIHNFSLFIMAKAHTQVKNEDPDKPDIMIRASTILQKLN